MPKKSAALWVKINVIKLIASTVYLRRHQSFPQKNIILLWLLKTKIQSQNGDAASFIPKVIGVAGRRLVNERWQHRLNFKDDGYIA